MQPRGITNVGGIGMSHPVVIVEYDPKWPTLYEEEKRRLLDAIGHKAVAIEHIGSTAVPGLGAKPIVDIMMGVADASEADECVPLLQNVGYTDVTPEPGQLDWYYCLGRTFRRDNIRIENFHLHLVRYGSDHWKKHLLFRDFLRAHPSAAERYYALKRAMAAKHGADRTAYTEAKTSFIESIIAQASRMTKQASP